MGSLLGGRAFWLAVVTLVGGIALAAAWGIVNVLPEIQRGGYEAATTTPSASTLPSGAATATPEVVMNGALIPGGAQCSGCHVTDRGVIGLRAIPAMGHPLEGWTECTACHAAASLVDTAPGHTGIHATECLTCHLPGTGPAPLSRPHRDRQNTACLDCHGSVAPLPSDMTHRSETVCWLCHRLPGEEPPVPAHQTVAGESDCLTCHVDGKVGALPPDHAARTVKECLLCHEVPTGTASPSPVAKVSWPGS